VSGELRVRMAAVRNAIVSLEKAKVPIFKETLLKVLESTKRSGVAPKDMLNKADKLTKEAREMIQKEINLQRP